MGLSGLVSQQTLVGIFGGQQSSAAAVAEVCVFGAALGGEERRAVDEYFFMKHLASQRQTPGRRSPFLESGANNRVG